MKRKSLDMSDRGPVEREDSWVLLDGLDFESAGEYAASPPGGGQHTLNPGSDGFGGADEPPPYNELVPEQHQASLSEQQQRAVQDALRCATAAVEADAALDAERARYFYIRAANTLSALDQMHERAASYIRRAELLEQRRPRSAGPPVASAPVAPAPAPAATAAAPAAAQHSQQNLHPHAPAGPAVGASSLPQSHSNQMEQQLQAAAAHAARVASVQAAHAHAHAAGGVGSRSVPPGRGSVPAVGSASAPVGQPSEGTAASRPRTPKSTAGEKWKSVELKAKSAFRAGIAHCDDREHRQGKRMFIQAAEFYQVAIQHARRERPDVVVLLQMNFEQALSKAEQLHKHLALVYNPSQQKGPDKGLNPIFSEQDQRTRRRSRSPKPAARAAPAQPPPRRPVPTPPPAAAAAHAAGGGGGGGSASITPAYWDRSIQNKDADFVLRPMAARSQAYKDAALRFYDTIDPNEYQIVSIELLQHPRKWASYHAQREILNVALANGANEVQAFHGTRADHVQTILAQGFLRDHNTHSAYGKGSYFAKNAKFSVPDYCPPDRDGISHVFLSRLLVGEPCKGGPGKKLPDPKPNGGGALYDSMVDDVGNPKIFVLGSGSDDHAYPEFLLKVKKIR